jgi:hypothetical protein
MEDYKINIVSEHLKDRHPFNEAPFNERYDNSEVSVFIRGLPCGVRQDDSETGGNPADEKPAQPKLHSSPHDPQPTGKNC